MKLGIITSIFDGWTCEEMIDEVSRIGYETIEVASWPQGKAERRYAGVTHVDAERVLEDDAYAQHLLDYAAEHHVQIGALAYYPNNMDADLERRRVCNEHLINVIHAAKKLGVKVIAVTSKPESPLAAAADAVLVVPGRVKGEAGGSIQLLSSLFDQSVHIALDALCLMLSRRDNVSDADANANHANVE